MALLGLQHNFLKQELLDIDVKDKKTFKHGIVMWTLLFLGYMFFCANWLIMSKLEGNSNTGWVKKIFGSGTNQLVIESVNYCIPIARGVVTILAAWLIEKLTHKRAALLSFLLTTAALPLIFSPHWSLFIIGRMVMAFGGTLLIIYISPVIATFFEPAFKGKIAMWNGMAYVFGALLINGVFLSSSVKTALLNNWQITATIFSLLTFIPLIGYFFLGHNFKIHDKNHEDNNDLPTQQSTSTYKSVISQKDTWLWIIFYSLLLVISLLVSIFFPKIVEKKFSIIHKSITQLDWSSLYTFIFYCGCAAGMSMGLFNKKKIQKTNIVKISCFITLAFWFFIILACVFLQNIVWLANLIIFLSVFVVSFCGLGVQSVLLYIPYEYKENNSKRLTIFFGLLWGVGYVIFAFYNMIAAAALDKNPALAIGLLTGFLIMYVILSFFIRESHPEYPAFPWSKGVKDVPKSKLLQEQPQDLVMSESLKPRKTASHK